MFVTRKLVKESVFMCNYLDDASTWIPLLDCFCGRYRDIETTGNKKGTYKKIWTEDKMKDWTLKSPTEGKHGHFMSQYPSSPQQHCNHLTSEPNTSFVRCWIMNYSLSVLKMEVFTFPGQSFQRKENSRTVVWIYMREAVFSSWLPAFWCWHGVCS